ncbi:50S ribosomal protein L18 [Bacillus tianshenii]|nr:50S ribosomal protein L18 [Bacillus tianshenii]
MITKADKNKVRKKRHARVRSKITGTPERPRLNIFRSNKHIYAQLIDDLNGVTVASASSQDKDFNAEGTANVDAAKEVGTLIAKRAVENGHKVVVFDRGGYLYHGRVKALADAAREAGLEF